MGRETIYEKGRRLFDEDRVEYITTIGGAGAAAIGTRKKVYLVAGDSGMYKVDADDYGMRCNCPTRGRCSHEVAVFAFRTDGR